MGTSSWNGPPLIRHSPSLGPTFATTDLEAAPQPILGIAALGDWNSRELREQALHRVAGLRVPLRRGRKRTAVPADQEPTVVLL
jgi:hypothetical protein